MMRAIGIIIVSLILTSCGRNTVFEKYIKMEKLSWSRFNNLQYEIPIKKIGAEYDIIFALRHTQEIPYDEIRLNCTLSTPSGEIRSLEYEIRIKDRSGALIGSRVGDLYNMEYALRRNYKFKKTGLLRVELENLMPRVETPGIIDIGLIVRKSK